MKISYSSKLLIFNSLECSDIRVILRGKAHTRIKLSKTGERRSIQDNQYILNEKLVVWDQGKHFSGIQKFILYISWK